MGLNMSNCLFQKKQFGLHALRQIFILEDYTFEINEERTEFFPRMLSEIKEEIVYF